MRHRGRSKTMQPTTLNHSALVKSYAQLPKALSHGEGEYVFDLAEKRYVDFYGGHAVSLLGHTPRLVIDAITAQAEKLFFYSNVASLEIRERAAQALIDFSNGIYSQVFFCNSGAEANENALKLAIQLTGRQKLVAFKGSFHGRTHLASSVTDNSKWHQHYPAWQGPVEFIPVNDLEALTRIDKEVAGVILEPIQSIAGVVEFDLQYLALLRERCSSVGAFLIFDEIQTGMGRTGVPMVSGLKSSTGTVIRPDMASLAKGVAAGFPVGALLLSEPVASAVKLGDLGSTFGGGPLACAAVLATVAEVSTLLEHVQAIEAAVRDEFSDLAVVRGRGCLLGLKFEFQADWIMQRLFERGFIVGTSGDKSVLRLLPPLMIPIKHVQPLAQALSETIREGYEALALHAKP